MASKRKLLIATISSLLALSPLAILAVQKSSQEVSAGASKIFIANANSVNGSKINGGDFVTKNVSAKNSRIVFKDKSSVVTTGYVRNLIEYGVKDTLIASLNLGIDSLASDGEYVVAFGLSTVRASSDSEGVLEVKFTNSGSNVYTSVVAHFPNNVNSNVLGSTFYDDVQFGKTFTLDFSFTSDRHFSLAINEDKKVDNKYVPGIEGTGYFGIYSKQSGNNCSAGNLSVETFDYALAENPDYLETFDDFEENAYNSKVFFSQSNKSILPDSYLSVIKLEDGNRVLHFSNTADAHITTVHQYSNFELKFDLMDLKVLPHQNPDGSYANYISQWFGIAFGVNSPRIGVDTRSVRWLQFEGQRDNWSSLDVLENPRNIFWENNKGANIESMNGAGKVYLYDPTKEGATYNIKFTMIDGVASYWIKTPDMAEFPETPMGKYDYGTTPLGYVRIFTWGSKEVSTYGPEFNGVANFKLDNISIKNLDYEEIRKTITVGKTPNYIPDTPDFPYVDETDPNDLLSAQINAGISKPVDNSNTTLIIVLSVVGGVVVLGGVAALVVVMIRRKKHV